MDNLEPQDEMKEVLNEEPVVEETTEEVQEETTEETQEEEKVEVDFSDPKIKEAIRIQREKDQEAVNRRIAKEVGKRKAVENQFSDFRSEFDEFKKQFVKEPTKPKLEDFEDPNEFVKASMEFHTKSQARPQQQQQQVNPSLQEFAEKEKAYAEKHPGYYDKVNDLIPFTKRNPDLLDAIYDAGPEVADYLADNLEVVDSISTYTPARLGRAIAQIENKFKRSQPLPKKANIKPAPTADNRGSTTTTKDISTMSQYEYNKFMESL